MWACGREASDSQLEENCCCECVTEEGKKTGKAPKRNDQMIPALSFPAEYMRRRLL